MNNRDLVILKMQNEEKRLAVAEALSLLKDKIVSPFALYRFGQEEKWDILMNLEKQLEKASRVASSWEPRNQHKGERLVNRIKATCPECHRQIGIAIFPFESTVPQQLEEAQMDGIDNNISVPVVAQGKCDEEIDRLGDGNATSVAGRTTAGFDEEDTEEIGIREYVIDGNLDLRTFTLDEVADLIPDYLQACRDKGIISVRVIHEANAESPLCHVVNSLLESLPYIESFDTVGLSYGAVTTIMLLSE